MTLVHMNNTLRILALANCIILGIIDRHAKALSIIYSAGTISLVKSTVLTDIYSYLIVTLRTLESLLFSVCPLIKDSLTIIIGDILKIAPLTIFSNFHCKYSC